MRIKARTLMLKARIYRFVAAVFAFVGLAVFGMIFMRNMGQGVAHALSDPSMVAMLILPFLPAVVLSWRAKRMEKLFRSMVKDMPPAAAKPKK